MTRLRNHFAILQSVTRDPFIGEYTSKESDIMPSFSPIVMNDGTADHTFNPRGIDGNGVATLVESTGVPIADRRLTVSRSRTPAGREKVSFKLTLPVIVNAVDSGVTHPTLARTAYADVVLSFDGTSTTAERAAARHLVSDLLTEAAAGSLIDSLEYVY